MNRHRFRFAVAVMLGGVFALALAHPASAFIRLARQADANSPVVEAHWNNDELPLQSVINPANNDKSNAVALATLIASGKAWEDIPTSYFTVNPHEYTGAPPEIPPALAFDGQNSVLFDPTGAIGNFPTGVIAFVRSVIDTDDGHTLDADMVLNDRDFWWSTSASIEPAPAGQSSVDLQAVATHEYGHYFSLDHTSVLGATMIPFIQNDTSQRSLEQDDMSGNSTVYPEASFLSDYGSISGTVVSGYNGSAIFGAHVEALPIVSGSPTVTGSVSAISGEITLRNGQGEYTIHGLPPGNYAVRIVPLDGIHTTANDGNIGGPYNGLDINFEPEFWNGAGESGNGFTDPPTAEQDVAVTAGNTTTGVNFITNTYAGRVIIAQHGQFENVVTFRSTGYLAVRFDPPFDGAYNIDNVEFPSFTFNGVPATFLSARLCVLDPATGLPDLANPLFISTPFAGSPNGVNTVPLNIAGTVGQTYFWVLQFPSQAIPGFPNNFPFLRMDFVQMERGLYANSYTIPLSGPGAGTLIDRNIVVTMQCQLADVNDVPIVGSRNLGGNRRATNMEFSFVPPGNVRADGFALPHNSLDHIELVSRGGAPGTYTLVAAGGAGAGSIKLDPQPPNNSVLIWATQAVDKNGNKSVLSNVTITGLSEDADEPNGQANQATLLTPPVTNRPETYSPAGDQDYYAINAKPGDVIDVRATHVGTLDGRNDPDYVMFLLDQTGEIVAFNDDFTGLDPRIIFTVPPVNGNSSGKQPRKFTVWVTDFYASIADPTGNAPRIPTPLTYRLDATVTTPVGAAASFARGLDPEQYHFVNSGPNPSNPSFKFLYIIPKSAGSQGVTLRIYGVNGRLVRTIVNGTQTAGPYTAVWDGRDDQGLGVSSGTYYARIKIGSAYQEDTRITLLK